MENSSQGRVPLTFRIAHVQKGNFELQSGDRLLSFHMHRSYAVHGNQAKVENMQCNEYAEPVSELPSVLQIYFLQVSESNDALQPLTIANYWRKNRKKKNHIDQLLHSCCKCLSI